MLSKPAFKSHLRVEVFPGEGVLLLSEHGSKVLHGDAFEKVVPLLDGHHSTDSIVDALAHQVDAARVYYVLNMLQARGYLAEGAQDIPQGIAAFWQASGMDAAVAQAALRENWVAVLTVGTPNSAPMVRALNEMGFTLGSKDDAQLWIVLTDDYLRIDLASINATALETNRPWLLVRLTGREMWVGPLFQPNATGCWQCMAERLTRNRAVHRFIAQKKNLREPPVTALGALPATQAAACQMATVAAAQFLVDGKSGLTGKVMSLDWVTFTSQTHILHQHPHCAACATAAMPAREPPMQLQSVAAAFTRDGGHRSVLPEKTLQKYEHLVSPITGLVHTLVPIHQRGGIAHVYVAGHNHAMRMDRLDSLKAGLRSASCGKGVSELQAKASALCEALERYSGEFTGTEMRVKRTLQDFRDGEAIHPNKVMLYSARQYAQREDWNRRGSRFNIVPEPFEQTKAVDWSPLWSLTAQRYKYLPTQLLYYRAQASDGDDTLYCAGCSNGNAAGNTLEEAVLQGFFELVERDAVALWWYSRLKKPAVAVDTFGEPYLLELQEFYRSIGREAWALDITSDLGIPAFAAISRLRDGPQQRILFGLGCHLEARIALQRAFTELNQMLGVAENLEEQTLSVEDDETVHWLAKATVDNQPYLTPDPALSATRCSDYPGCHREDLLDNIRLCQRIVEERGMELLVLNQTRPDTALPVVKVVVPGLRHFWARYAPGRLYDVPVEKGWLSRPLDEDELNPIPVFL
jgi:ribosomal protein S12 methylthiotransferase accessory factor